MSDKNKEVILSLKDVDITFNQGTKKEFKAVKNVSFDIKKGDNMDIASLLTGLSAVCTVFIMLSEQCLLEKFY